jgi:hypothetical protein
MNELRSVTNTVPSAFMCWKCREIDTLILRYRALGDRWTDDMMLKGLQRLVDKLEAEKKALHPERQE